jgi:MFS family permease
MDGKDEKDLEGPASSPADPVLALPKSDEEAGEMVLPEEKLSSARLVAIASVATFTMILSSMGNSALNIALPTIQVELGMNETDLQWIASAYSLTFGCFLLLAGRLADVHGRKLVFLCGVSWYGIWTLIGPFIPNGAGLVVSRALTGCGAAMA